MNEQSTEYKATTAYRINYTKGWQASERCGGGLDEAESRFIARNDVAWDGPEVDAWEDGWLDMAAGRPKWHLRDCQQHHNDEGGCGIA